MLRDPIVSSNGPYPTHRAVCKDEVKCWQMNKDLAHCIKIRIRQKSQQKCNSPTTPKHPDHTPFFTPSPQTTTSWHFVSTHMTNPTYDFKVSYIPFFWAKWDGTSQVGTLLPKRNTFVFTLNSSSFYLVANTPSPLWTISTLIEASW